MSDVIQHTKKICGVFEKAGYFVQIVLQNGTNMTGNVFGNVPLLETIGLFGGLISRLLASCVLCSVYMNVLFK